jgi:hypothetical protein
MILQVVQYRGFKNLLTGRPSFSIKIFPSFFSSPNSVRTISSGFFNVEIVDSVKLSEDFSGSSRLPRGITPGSNGNLFENGKQTFGDDQK